MKRLLNTSLVIFLLVLLTACEGLDKKIYERTPHMPVFAGMEKDSESKSNPYWSRFSAVNDTVEVRTSTGGVHLPDRPSMYGSLGTYYRFPQNYYLYMMTGGYGAQYDYFVSDTFKFSPTLYLGFAGTRGAGLSVSKKVGNLFDGDVIVYAAIQRQEINVNILCVLESKSCSSLALNGATRVAANQDTRNTLLGLQLGRFQIGTKGYNTVLFKFELGLHEVLTNTITAEQYAPSNFEPDKSATLISAYADFTLW